MDTSKLVLGYRIWSQDCDIDHLYTILTKQGGWLTHRAGGCYDVYIPYGVRAWYLVAYPSLYRKKDMDLIV
jgi:hypothetical protein